MTEQTPIISILCPTRDRPKFVKQLISSAIQTAEKPHLLEFIFYIDNDDRSYDLLFDQLEIIFEFFFKDGPRCKVIKIAGDRIILSEMWNVCWKVATADIFMHCGDDIRFRTKNWDKMICDKFDEFPDKILFAYGYDGFFHNKDFGTHGFIHRNWTNVLGRFVPPYFCSDYNDTWLNDIAKELDRHFYVDMYTEHIHPAAGKYHYDKTHEERLSRARKENPLAIYNATAQERIDCSNKLRNFINNFNNENKQMNIGFIGLGKLGLPCALAIDKAGHNVYGYDIDPQVKEILDSKVLPYKEIHADVYLKDHNIEFCGVDNVVSQSDIIFVPIQTPHDPKYEGVTRLPKERVDFDYSFLKEGIKNLSDEIEKQGVDKIVVIISTVLPGTIEREIKPLLCDNIKLCYNPFFIAMGTTIKDFINPEFVLFGVEDETAYLKTKAFYETIHSKPMYRCTIEEAEMVKVSYNTFITMKICMANTVMEVAHKLNNINCDNVMKALFMADERVISTKYLLGGMGDGGGCHPRDNIALSWLAQKLDISYDWYENLMICREEQTEWLGDLIVEKQQESNLPIIILGKCFKKETNLTVGSPSILLKNLLAERGVSPGMYDPWIDEGNPPLSLPAVFFIGTNHDIFKDYNFPKGSIIIDPWGMNLKNEECTYIQVGR